MRGALRGGAQRQAVAQPPRDAARAQAGLRGQQQRRLPPKARLRSQRRIAKDLALTQRCWARPKLNLAPPRAYVGMPPVARGRERTARRAARAARRSAPCTRSGAAGRLCPPPHVRQGEGAALHRPTHPAGREPALDSDWSAEHFGHAAGAGGAHPSAVVNAVLPACDASRAADGRPRPACARHHARRGRRVWRAAAGLSSASPKLLADCRRRRAGRVAAAGGAAASGRRPCAAAAGPVAVDTKPERAAGGGGAPLRHAGAPRACVAGPRAARLQRGGGLHPSPLARSRR